MKKLFNLHPNVLFLGLVSLFTDFSSEMIQSVMPIFLSVTLGVSPFGIGLIEGVADALASFLKIFSGWISDKIQKRKILAFFGYTLSVLAKLFLVFTTAFTQVFSLRLIDRIGKGFRDSPRDALLAESVSRDELGKSFGYQRAMDALGGTLGPLTAFLILPAIYNNYRLLFLIAFGVGILALVSFLFVSEKKLVARPEFKINFQAVRKNKPFLIYIGTIFIFTLGILPITLMLLKLVEIDSSIGSILAYANIPLVYFIYSFITVFTSIPFGKLADKIGEKRVIVFGILAAIASYLGLAFSTNPFLVVFFFALFGLYPAATDGVERALAAKLVDDRILATGEGMLHAAVGTASLLAGAIGGFLWTFVSSEAAFIYAAIMATLGLVVFIIVNINGAPKVSSNN